MIRTAKLTLLAIALMSYSGSAFAATDGTVGTTSTGTSVVSLTIPQLVLITGVADIPLGSYSGTGTEAGNDDVTVAGNDDQASPTYQVGVSSPDCVGAQFKLLRSAPAAPVVDLNMTVSWNDQTGLTGAATVSCTAALAAQTGIHAALGTATANANISVSISEAALQAAPYGTYGTTLTMVITPE